MPRDPRTYITVHDGMPEHPKVELLSDAAFRLLMTSWCWCSRNRTDGRIVAASWNRRGTPRSRRELIDAGLAEVTPDGVYMHDYTEHQRTAAEIDELTNKRAEAGRKGGQAKANGLALAMARATAKGKQAGGKDVADTETDTEEQKDSSSSVADAPSDDKTEPLREDVERLCRQLADRIEANGSKRPRITAKWRQQCRLLLDEDGRTEAQVSKAIDWCQADTFWMSVILSMPKLREKYDAIRLKAAEKAKPTIAAVPSQQDYFTPPPAPTDMPSNLRKAWAVEWSRANREGRPGPADWRELEAS